MQRVADFFRRQEVLAACFLLFLSYFTIVHAFWYPQNLFWDENYHIASAQKYLNGIHFMEPHPPMGKLVIALGEAMLDKNEKDDQFIGTDYASNPPTGFSYTGYRLFPVLLAWLTVPIIFAIFLLLLRNTLWAMLGSFLYIFDNALLVHVRSAMLDSTMIFFASATILAYLLALEWKDRAREFRIAAVLFGLAFAGVMTTKLFGLILVLLLPALAYALRDRLVQLMRFIGIAGVAFLLLYCSVWYIHFAVGARVNSSLPDEGYYQASQTYKNILSADMTRSPFAFPILLKDHLGFVSHYEAGVPRLDLCKKDENGSPWFFWPFGGRTINYRWETPNGQVYRYLYLVPNPVVWLLGLIGILGAAGLLLFPLVLPMQEQVRQRFHLATFLGLYISYLAAISRIDRVMYLYHYFIPLILSFILFALVFMELRRFGKWRLDEQRKTTLLLVVGGLIFLSFEFFRPFTYYEPLSDVQFKRRSWLKLWDMKCVKCDEPGFLAKPV